MTAQPLSVPLCAGRGFFVAHLPQLARERHGLSRDFVRSVQEGQSVASHGSRPDYGSGPHLALVTAAVQLARQDLSDPLYSASARWFLLNSDLVDLFAECLGIEPEMFVSG